MPHAEGREAVFVARTSGDERRAEAVLARHAITYSVSLEPSEETPDSAVCFLRLVYAVPREEADRVRALLLAEGLAYGVLSPRPGDR